MYTFSSAFLYVHIRNNQIVTYWTKVFQKKFLKNDRALFCRGGVEDTRHEAKPKATKKSEAKAKDSLSEDRPSRVQGQGPRTQAQELSKKIKEGLH